MNRETEHFLLMADNDKATYNFLLETVREAPNNKAAAKKINVSMMLMVAHTSVISLPRAYEEVYKSIAMELLTQFYSQVDYAEVARHYRQKLREGAELVLEWKANT